MPTLVLQVGASTDDARNISGDSTFTATAVTQHIGINAGVDYWNGWRFTNVTVPQGVTVNSASLDLFSAGVTSGTSAQAIFYGVGADNATTFANTAGNKPETKARTTASATKSLSIATWNTTGFGVDPIDVTSLVQEIINRVGWSSGNALAIVGHDNGSAANTYIGYSTWDFSGNARGANLTIDYIDPNAPTAPASLTATQSGGTIDLSWPDVANETSYEIQRKRGGSSNYYTVATPAADATNYSDTTVGDGYTYTYRIRSVNASGTSAWTTSSSVTMTGTKAWTSYIQGWVYPGQADAVNDYTDGRVMQAIKPEYATIDNSGNFVIESNEGVYGVNVYTPANVASVKAYCSEPYFTISANRTGMSALVASATLKQSAIDNITTMLTDSGFTGVELDWEGYGTWTASDYTNFKTFVDSLTAAVHGIGKKIIVIGPPITNSTEQSFYQWKYEDFESSAVDYVLMMVYDYQYDYGAGVSVQPASWAQNACAWIRSKISDVNRIIIGMPNYGYHGATGGFTISIDTKAQSATYTGYNTATRNADGEMTWANAGTSYVFQDTTGINTKRERIEDEGITYVSVWHLGDNDWFSGKAELASGGGSGPAPTATQKRAFFQFY